MEGRHFFSSNVTPPPVPPLGQDEFFFDLQRFVVEDSGWSSNTNKPGSDTETLGDDEINGNIAAANANIKVTYKDGSNNDQTKYFQYMQSAMNYVCGNKVEFNSAYAPNGATVTLLKDFDGQGSNPTGYAFFIGRPTDKDLDNDYATNVTIDLNGHTYRFATTLKGKFGVSKIKAIQTSPGANHQVISDVTIKNGTMGVDSSVGSQFQRFMKSYVNLTLEDFTLDTKNFAFSNTTSSGVEQGFDGSLINAYIGEINVKGSTTITGLPTDYYAIGGKLDNNGNYKDSSFKITVDKDATGTIDNIAVYEEKPSFKAGTEAFKDSVVSIAGGNVGALAFSTTAIQNNVMNYVTIDSGAVVGSITDTGNILAYSEVNAAAKSYDTRNSSSEVWFYAGQEGWSKGSSNTTYNYVAASLGAESLKAGEAIVTATNVKDTQSLAYDSTNYAIGIPTMATATFSSVGTTKDQYAVAKMKYNNSSTKVTVSDVTLGGSAPAKLVIKADSVGAGLFDSTVTDVDASAVTAAVSIVGNGLDNAIYGGAAATSMFGGAGKDTFYYSGGADVITDYVAGTDKVVYTDTSFAPTGSEISISSSDLVLNFGEKNALTFSGQGTVSAPGTAGGIGVDIGKKNYYYTKDFVQDFTGGEALGVTLAAGYAESVFAPTASNYATINAAARTASTALNITGTNNDNYIVAAKAGGSLSGGVSGNNTLVGGAGTDIFVYASGKGVIENYGAAGVDSLSADVTKIASAKVSGNKLTFTIDDSNTLTFTDADADTRISLTSGEILSKDGYVKDNMMTLFKDTKGRIEAKELGATKGINAAAVTGNVVTMVGASVDGGGLYTFAAKNTKADVFEYGGGIVSLANYEAGKDKINLGNYSFSGFSIGEDGAVSLNTNAGTVVLQGAIKDTEVLLHDGERNKSNQYSKLVFAENGVIHDKAKNPTSATVLAGATAYTTNDSIKKITVESLTADSGAISIGAGNVNTNIDASEAGNAAKITFVSGKKNDKFIASDGKDLFFYTEGKDVIDGFGTGDSISFGGDYKFADVEKISKSSSSVTFKFKKNNSLTVKGDIDKAISIDGTSYEFGKKSAIIADGVVSLTSGFSGTYTADGSATSIVGSAVDKNLTLKGKKGEADYLVAGSGKKTMLKGQGGNDTLVGGSGTDTFYYKKGEDGDIHIQKFGAGQDKIKISGSKVVESLDKDGDKLKITLKDATITIDSIDGKDSYTADKVLLKANNTYYWFDSTYTPEDSSTTGAWVTTLKKVSNSTAKGLSDYSIVDLGYSTNLVKAGLAYKADIALPTASAGGGGSTEEQSST